MEPPRPRVRGATRHRSGPGARRRARRRLRHWRGCRARRRRTMERPSPRPVRRVEQDPADVWRHGPAAPRRRRARPHPRGRRRGRREPGSGRSGATAAAAEGDADPPSCSAWRAPAGTSTVGSTFLPTEPDTARISPLLLRRAAEYLPAVADAEVVGRRLCARPQSVDGRPFIGPMAGVDGLYVCAGHGHGASASAPRPRRSRRARSSTAPPPSELEGGPLRGLGLFVRHAQGGPVVGRPMGRCAEAPLHS